MNAPSVLLPACANWIPGTPPCKRQGRRACSDCKLVVVSTSPLLEHIDTQHTLTYISIVKQIAKRHIGQSIRRSASLQWARTTGAQRGTVKVANHHGPVAQLPRTGITCLEATNTCGEILQPWMSWSWSKTRASAIETISHYYSQVSTISQSGCTY